MLRNIRIRKHLNTEDPFMEKERDDKGHSVWEFIAKNAVGATYELLSPTIAGDVR